MSNDHPNASQRSFAERKAKIVRRTFIGLSAVLWLGIAICYPARFDAVAAVTILPIWIWGIPGLGLAALAWGRGYRRWVVFAAGVWFLTISILMPESTGLVRVVWHRWPDQGWVEARKAGEAIRVISLNVGPSSLEDLEELVRYEPDIVLLQEGQSRKGVEQLARLLFGDEAVVVWSIDPSILARGRLISSHAPLTKESFFVQSRVELAGGRTVEIFSLRLSPPLMRTDYWNPRCWQEHAADRRQRRADLSRLVERLEAVPDNIPLIVGGDFNCPAGDAVFRLLKPRLSESFAAGGVGWGNTIISRMPFHRIDQVWVSGHFKPAAVVAQSMAASDHRGVICDLLWARNIEENQHE